VNSVRSLEQTLPSGKLRVKLHQNTRDVNGKLSPRGNTQKLIERFAALPSSIKHRRGVYRIKRSFTVRITIFVINGKTVRSEVRNNLSSAIDEPRATQLLFKQSPRRFSSARETLFFSLFFALLDG
jgi:hypothetical protein